MFSVYIETMGSNNDWDSCCYNQQGKSTAMSRPTVLGTDDEACGVKPLEEKVGGGGCTQLTIKLM
jgi:hypothetical protein